MTTRRTRPEGVSTAGGGDHGGAGTADRTADEKLRDARKHLLELEERLAEADARAKEAGDKHLRVAAEMENMRRRHRQADLERLEYANSELLAKLLPVLDNLERALDHAPREEGAEPSGETLAQWLNGIVMVERQLREVLASEGVNAIEALGQPFDPVYHQAAMAEPSAEFEEGTVIGELQRGYTMNDRVLRPSLVKVAQ